jgi:hypothetical protein
MMTTPGLQPADVLDNPYDDIDESSFSFVTDPAIKRLMAIVLGVVFIESAACKGHSSIELSKNIADISNRDSIVGAAVNKAISQLIGCCPLPLNIIRQFPEEFKNAFVSSSFLLIPFLAPFRGRGAAMLLLMSLAHFAESRARTKPTRTRIS